MRNEGRHETRKFAPVEKVVAPPRAAYQPPLRNGSTLRAPAQEPPPGDWTGVWSGITGESPPAPPPPEPAPMAPLNAQLVRYAQQVERDLVAAASAPPDEALLAKLAGGEISTALELQDLQSQIARRLVILIDHPDQMMVLARVLRELGVVLSSATRRVQTTLATSASLRAQRRFLRSANET
jgi:hypothetical protein